MTAPGESWLGPIAGEPAERITLAPAAAPVFDELGFLASGSYEDYEVHCLFRDPADAERAVAELEAQGRSNFHAGVLPVMPPGRIPRRVKLYKVALHERHVYGHKPFLDEGTVWEWQAPALGENDRNRLGRGVLAEVIGTDPRIVWQAAERRSAELHAELIAKRRKDAPDVRTNP